MLKINFSDFWGDFNKEDNLVINTLRQKYEVEISDKPDILFYSVYSKIFYKYNCIRILFTGENIRPNFEECDFSISFDHESYNGKNLRFPLFLFTPPTYYQKNINVEEVFSTKTNFCSFIVSNPNCKARNDFFELLCKYKKVDSGGKFKNNLGYNVKNKSDLLQNYKFNIAFENELFAGYTTEKIIEPIMNNCIPIYWGNPRVVEDFNTKSFINVLDYKSFDEVVEVIKNLDNNDSLYKKMLAEPFLHDNKIPEKFEYKKLTDFLIQIVENKNNIKPVAKFGQKINYYTSIFFRKSKKIIRKIIK